MGGTIIVRQFAIDVTQTEFHTEFLAWGKNLTCASIKHSNVGGGSGDEFWRELSISEVDFSKDLMPIIL